MAVKIIDCQKDIKLARNLEFGIKIHVMLISNRKV